MKFPKYTRKENRACKLTDEQIKEIRYKHKNGVSYEFLSKQYNVTPQAIYYWCISDEKRKELIKRHRNPSIRKFFDFKEYRKRKKFLHPELKNYELFSRNRYKNNPQLNAKKTIQNAGKNYWRKHRERLIIKNKIYQQTHLDKFREYNKTYREKHKERVKELQKQSYLRNKDKKLAHNRKKYREKNPIVMRKSKYDQIRQI